MTNRCPALTSRVAIGLPLLPTPIHPMVCGFVKAVVTTTTVKHALRDEGIAGIAGTIGQNHPEWIKADIPRRADLASEGLHRRICAFCDPKSAFARRKT